MYKKTLTFIIIISLRKITFEEKKSTLSWKQFIDF